MEEYSMYSYMYYHYYCMNNHLVMYSELSYYTLFAELEQEQEQSQHGISQCRWRELRSLMVQLRAQAQNSCVIFVD